MLRVFISYDKADIQQLSTLLNWLEPLRLNYFAKIWYNRYTKYDIPNQLQRTHELHNANLYIFLTSYSSIGNGTIQGEEVSVALDRYERLGPNVVRIRPVLLAPCHWKDNSRLLLHQKNALPKGKELSKFDHKEDGLIEILGGLRVDIIELREAMMMEAKRKGESLVSFNQEFALPKALAPTKMQWRWQKTQEMLWVLLLLYLIHSVYTIGCHGKDMPYKDVPSIKNDQKELLQ